MNQGFAKMGIDEKVLDAGLGNQASMSLLAADGAA